LFAKKIFKKKNFFAKKIAKKKTEILLEDFLKSFSDLKKTGKT
jgi:hypothetical protein